MGATIAIGCKLPAGIHLDLFADTGARAPTERDGHKMYMRKARITLRGSSSAKKAGVLGGYGITPDVPIEFWEQWKSANADHPWLAKGIVFEAKNAAVALDISRERAAVRTGFEPLDPEVVHVMDGARVQKRTED